VAAIDAADEPVILVGHSMGGMVISLASAQRQGRVAGAGCVRAFLLPDGKSIFAYSQSTPEFASSLPPKYLVVEPDKGVSWIKPRGVREAFLADASDDDFAWAEARTQVDYLAPSATPVSLDGGFASARWRSPGVFRGGSQLPRGQGDLLLPPRRPVRSWRAARQGQLRERLAVRDPAAGAGAVE
jgi:pimeloyl-ACP methyl ester carboxylesterase